MDPKFTIPYEMKSFKWDPYVSWTLGFARRVFQLFSPHCSLDSKQTLSLPRRLEFQTYSTSLQSHLCTLSHLLFFAMFFGLSTKSGAVKPSSLFVLLSRQEEFLTVPFCSKSWGFVPNNLSSLFSLKIRQYLGTFPDVISLQSNLSNVNITLLVVDKLEICKCPINKSVNKDYLFQFAMCFIWELSSELSDIKNSQVLSI